MRYWLKATLFVVFLSPILASCRLSAPAAAEPTKLDARAVITSAAQTAEARRLELLAKTGTPLPVALLETAMAPSPTDTPSSTNTPLATTALPATTSLTLDTTTPAVGGDRAEFVADVTVPDGTIFSAGEVFEKTWRLKNAGATTWTTAYSLIFIDGELMGAPAMIPLSKEVPPGESIDISVSMVAPTKPGTYRGYWKLRNANGQIFGVGVNANEAIWVEIVVQSSLSFDGGTPTTTQEQIVASLSLTVDNAEFIGRCPYTFVFSAQITLNEGASLTYNLEAGEKAGGMIKVPPPTTRTLPPGTHSIVYELTFPSSINGWARFRIMAPESLTSNQVSFTLTCW